MGVLLLLFQGVKAVLTQRLSMILKDHLVWTAGTGVPMHGVCISHRIPCAWEQQG